MKKEKNNTTTETTANKATFADLLRAYESETRNTTTATAYTTALETLATAVALSVLKKCIDVSQNPQLTEVRTSVVRDRTTLRAIDYSSTLALETVYTADGDKETKISDKDMYNAYNKLSSQCLGDGLDLVNTAIVALLEETRKADTEKENFLETPYSVRRLKKKVWIKTADSVNGWETVETTPIQEVYKAVRRDIEHSRAMSTDARNGYTYLEEYAKDTETDSETQIFKRLPKYADLGGYACDYNGAMTFYTADADTVADTEKLVESMNLTEKQAKVLQLRQSGYGYKAIATYLGVTQRAVAKTVQAIQVKAIAVGLTPDKK